MYTISGDDSGQAAQCDSSENGYLLNQTRFVTTIAYECGVTQGTPLVNAMVVGSDVTINISHRCFCVHSGGLQGCSSLYRAEETEELVETLKNAWPLAKPTIAVLLSWMLLVLEVRCTRHLRHMHLLHTFSLNG